MLTENEKKKIETRIEELKKELVDIELSESAAASVGASCGYPDLFAKRKRTELELTFLMECIKNNASRRRVDGEIMRVEARIKMTKNEMEKLQNRLDTFSAQLKHDNDLRRFLEDLRSRLFP